MPAPLIGTMQTFEAADALIEHVGGPEEMRVRMGVARGTVYKWRKPLHKLGLETFLRMVERSGHEVLLRQTGCEGVIKLVNRRDSEVYR